jgi:hypothetical protein
MNLFQIAEQVKDYPKEQLVKEMKQPSGSIPQYILLSELQRRKRMETSYAAQANPQDNSTVADETVAAAGVPAQGIGAIGKAMAPSSDPLSNNAMSAAPVQKMAAGGQVEAGRGQVEALINKLPFKYNDKSEAQDLEDRGLLDEDAVIGPMLEDFTVPHRTLNPDDVLREYFQDKDDKYYGIGKEIAMKEGGILRLAEGGRLKVKNGRILPNGTVQMPDGRYMGGSIMQRLFPTAEPESEPEPELRSVAGPQEPLPERGYGDIEDYLNTLPELEVDYTPSTSDRRPRPAPDYTTNNASIGRRTAATEVGPVQGPSLPPVKPTLAEEEAEAVIMDIPDRRMPAEAWPMRGPGREPRTMMDMYVSMWPDTDITPRQPNEMTPEEDAQFSMMPDPAATDPATTDPAAVTPPVVPPAVARITAPGGGGGGGGGASSAITADMVAPQTPEESDFAKQKWLALAQAGFTMMATRGSFGEKVGAGGIAGLGALGQARADVYQRSKDAADMAMKQAALAMRSRGGGGGRGGGGAKLPPKLSASELNYWRSAFEAAEMKLERTDREKNPTAYAQALRQFNMADSILRSAEATNASRFMLPTNAPSDAVEFLPDEE